MNPVILPGTVELVRELLQLRGESQRTFVVLEKEPHTDSALIAYCRGEKHNFGGHVDRYSNETHVTVYTK